MSTQQQESKTIHAAPLAGPKAVTDEMPCCGRTPFGVVQEAGHQDDEVTVDSKLVTCRGQ